MKKSIRILAAIVIAAAVTAFLCACTAEFPNYGDDEYIAGSSSNMSFGSVQTTNSDGTTWSVNSFGGVSVLKSNVEIAESGSLSVTLDYISGDLKIVAVNGDNVYKLIENESCNGELKTELTAGEYTLKIVGNEAKFKITYSL